MSTTRKSGGGLKEQLDSWLDTGKTSGDFENRHKKPWDFWSWRLVREIGAQKVAVVTDTEIGQLCRKAAEM